MDSYAIPGSLRPTDVESHILCVQEPVSCISAGKSLLGKCPRHRGIPLSSKTSLVSLLRFDGCLHEEPGYLKSLSSASEPTHPQNCGLGPEAGPASGKKSPTINRLDQSSLEVLASSLAWNGSGVSRSGRSSALRV